MNTITPVARAVLEVLDTCERGAGDTEICLAVGHHPVAGGDAAVSCDDLLHTIVELLDEGLIDARFREQPHDMGVTADPIIYAITEAGCDALWALMQAEAGWRTPPLRQFCFACNQIVPDGRWHLTNGSTIEFARPVFFASRESLRGYTKGVAA